MSTGFIVVSLLFLAGFILTLYIRFQSRKYEKQRSEIFRNIAGHIGMQFSIKSDKEFKKRIRPFYKFYKQGHKLSMIRNVLRENVNGVEMLFFECPIGSSRPKNMESFFYFKSSSLNLPSFHIRQGNVHQISFLNALGHGGVHIDHPAFSKKYLLTCGDENSVNRVFSNEFFDFISSNESFDIDGNADQIIVYRPIYEDMSIDSMGRLDPKEFNDVKQKAIEVYKYLSDTG